MIQDRAKIVLKGLSLTYVELKEIKLVEGYLMVLVMHCFFIVLTSKEKKTTYLIVN